ncbi:MAG TPA: response regulator, partial [Opitutales bacterium]|nr:response regulator [Opitutales bacterium]
PESVVAESPAGLSGEVVDQLLKSDVTTKTNGHGLGLTTIRTLIEFRGGRLKINSSTKSGASFVLTLPEAQPAQEKAAKKAAKSKEAPLAPDTFPTKPARVLVMDDDAWVREIAGDMLRHLGYEVEFAVEGRQAVEKFRHARATGHPFGAVILDIVVPSGQGAERTLEQLKASDPRVCAILSSGQPEHELMKHYSEHGFRGCVPKPFTLTDLNRAMKSLPHN